MLLKAVKGSTSITAEGRANTRYKLVRDNMCAFTSTASNYPPSAKSFGHVGESGEELVDQLALHAVGREGERETYCITHHAKSIIEHMHHARKTRRRGASSSST